MRTSRQSQQQALRTRKLSQRGSKLGTGGVGVGGCQEVDGHLEGSACLLPAWCCQEPGL